MILRKLRNLKKNLSRGQKMINPTSSLRQGLYPFFILGILFVGVYWRQWFGIFEAFLIIIGAGIIMKLTDIEEAIRDVQIQFKK